MIRRALFCQVEGCCGELLGLKPEPDWLTPETDVRIIFICVREFLCIAPNLSQLVC